MTWYYIILIIAGYIIFAYATGIILYVISAKNVDGVNLLHYEEDYIRTDKGILNVRKSLDNLCVLSIVAGIFFPITWIICLITLLIDIISWLLTPITKYIINKNI